MGASDEMEHHHIEFRRRDSHWLRERGGRQLLIEPGVRTGTGLRLR